MKLFQRFKTRPLPAMPMPVAMPPPPPLLPPGLSVIVMRHGKYQQDGSNAPDFNPRSRAAIAEIAEDLAALSVSHITIWSSPIERTVATGYELLMQLRQRAPVATSLTESYESALSFTAHTDPLTTLQADFTRLVATPPVLVSDELAWHLLVLVTHEQVIDLIADDHGWSGVIGLTNF